MADKYDVPRLRALVVSRLDTVCDLRKDEIDFIEALRVVDGCTANNTIWDILLPKAKANLQTLLKNEMFKEVIKEQSALTFQLLDSFASGSQDQSLSEHKTRAVADAEAPDAKRPRLLSNHQQIESRRIIPHQYHHQPLFSRTAQLLSLRRSGKASSGEIPTRLHTRHQALSLGVGLPCLEGHAVALPTLYQQKEEREVRETDNTSVTKRISGNEESARTAEGAAHCKRSV
jgi:hypothetical protein